MKKMIPGIFAIVLLASNSFGQSNNPYNKIGADVVTAANIVLQDYQSGKIKDIDQATLDHYFKTALPDYQGIKLQEFTNILNAVKNATNRSVISNSGLSNESKGFLEKSITGYSTTTLVDEVKQSKIPENEKQLVLTVLAINYNVVAPVFNKSGSKSSAKGPNPDFNINENTTAVANIRGGGGVVWGALGFILGNAFCGLPCGIVGGLIGLVLGSANSSSTTIGASGAGGVQINP